MPKKCIWSSFLWFMGFMGFHKFAWISLGGMLAINIRTPQHWPCFSTLHRSSQSSEVDGRAVHPIKPPPTILITNPECSVLYGDSIRDADAYKELHSAKAAPFKSIAPNPRDWIWDVDVFQRTAPKKSFVPNARHRIRYVDAFQRTAPSKGIAANARDWIRYVDAFQRTAPSKGIAANARDWTRDVDAFQRTALCKGVAANARDWIRDVDAFQRLAGYKGAVLNACHWIRYVDVFQRTARTKGIAPNARLATDWRLALITWQRTTNQIGCYTNHWRQSSAGKYGVVTLSAMYHWSCYLWLPHYFGKPQYIIYVSMCICSNSPKKLDELLTFSRSAFVKIIHLPGSGYMFSWFLLDFFWIMKFVSQTYTLCRLCPFITFKGLKRLKCCDVWEGHEPRKTTRLFDPKNGKLSVNSFIFKGLYSILVWCIYIYIYLFIYLYIYILFILQKSGDHLRCFVFVKYESWEIFQKNDIFRISWIRNNPGCQTPLLY